MNNPTIKIFISWLPVLAIGFAAFIFNTTEFIPMGLLTDIAKDFGIKPAEAGFVIILYSATVVLISLPLTILTSKYDRKKLLIILFYIFIGGHVFSYFSWSFSSLVCSRIIIACSHALFWSITTSLAVRVAPKGKQIVALSIMTVAISMATILGVPLGTLIGHYFGWRVPFLLIAILALLVIFFLIKLLPKLPSANSGSLKSIPMLFRRKKLIIVYLLTALVITGHFIAYSYISDFIENIAMFKKEFTVVVLFFMGGAGILGSIVFSKLQSKYADELLSSAVLVMGLCLTFLMLLSFEKITLVLLCIIWGTSMTVVALSLVNRVLILAHDATDIALSIYSSIFNIGIGGGALIGSLVCSKMSTGFIGYAGALFLFIAFIVSILDKKLNKISS